MASAIETVKAEGRARLAAANRRFRQKGMEQMLIRKAAVLSSAAVYGTLNRVGVPVDIAGFPWKVGVAALALLGEGLSKGATQAVMAGLADTTLAIYVERSISTNTLIAGQYGYGIEGDDDDDDDDDDSGEI